MSYFSKCCVFLSHSTGDGGLSISHIIINQLKWLDRVVDSKVVIFLMMCLVALATAIQVVVFIFDDLFH